MCIQNLFACQDCSEEAMNEEEIMSHLEDEPGHVFVREIHREEGGE